MINECIEQVLECKSYEKIKVCDTDLSIASMRILSDAGIIYLNDLTHMSTKDLLKWRNLGKKRLNEIREHLAKHNLCLIDESINPDIKNMILQDLPGILRGIKLQVDEAMEELRYFSHKLDQVSQACEKKSKKYAKDRFSR